MSTSLLDIARTAATVLLFIAAASIVLLMLRRYYPRLYKLVLSWNNTVIPSLQYRSRTVLRSESLVSMILAMLQGFRFLLTLGIIYITVILCVAIIPWTQNVDVRSLLNAVISALFIILIARFLLTGVQSLHRLARERLSVWQGTRIRSVSISSLEIVSADRIASILQSLTAGLRIVVSAVIIYMTMASVFGLFSFTKEWSSTLLQYIMRPLLSAVATIIGYLPNLFTVLVIVVLTRYAIKIVHLVFSEVEKGRFTLPGFYAEWADPTYKIVRFLMIVFAAVVIFPYLPGSESDAFKGISVFLGILFSFGSSSAVSSIVSGVVLTYMRPFRVGDRVKIAETVGDVVERTLLVTRVRTIKNVDITIPNSLVLGNHIVNYSAQAQNAGLILHTTVTIGYDVPWKKVHALLLEAARKTEHLLDTPAPFVLQTSLNDFFVSYELNASTDSPNDMATIYSHLHEHIQDAFNAAGVEIMSPHYTSVRDGNTVTIPEEQRPKGYTPKGFRIFPFGGTT